MNQKPSFNLFHTIMLVSGSMIGSGVFIVGADIARTVGSSGWLMMVWLLSGVVTLFAALSYGELAAMMPKAGGQFIYIKEAFGEFIAFLYGWTVFMVIQTGVIAAVAMAFAKFTGVYFSFFEEGNVLINLGFLKITSSQLLAVSTIILLTYTNSLGISKGKFIQSVFTVTKLIALFGLIIIGLVFAFKSDVLSTNLSNLWSGFQWKEIKQANSTSLWTKENLSGLTLFAAVGVAMIGSLFSSDAWNNVTFIAGDIKNPERNLPLGLFFGVLIVTVIYILANFAYLCYCNRARDCFCR
jgi:APA family basic amino acid/polyamine antiporter